MIPIPTETLVGLPMALALGLAYGMGPCLISCLPYLGPVFLARDFTLRQSWRVVLPLSLGRLAGYSTFGLAAGFAGHMVKDGIAAPTVRLVVGAAALMMGLALLWRQPACACSFSRSRSEPRTLLPGGLFLMGLGMALTPCAPLGVVLFSAATSGSAMQGGALGLFFGLGAIVVPSLVYGIGAAYFGRRLREELKNWRPAMERIAAGLLILVGLSNLLK
ncbi:MAG: sulfite exporter TauE/SafE family protein [Rhodocyclaceae bacterium]|nr:sulfite exporter TauE/SafE family protein [Rhodocyclaceae bacterium]